jgi:hypothetical protein
LKKSYFIMKEVRNMKTFFSFLLTVVVVFTLAMPAFADPINDPFFTQSGANTGSTWFSSSNTSYLDTISGKDTLVYFLIPSAFPGMVSGDLLITLTSGGPVTDLIRFETVAGVGPAAFIFSNQNYGLPDDVGLPATFQSNNVTRVISDLYTPLSVTDPGYVAGKNGAANWSYELAPVPEPGTMMLLGVGMFGLAIYGKRRNNNKA